MHRYPSKNATCKTEMQKQTMNRVDSLIMKPSLTQLNVSNLYKMDAFTPCIDNDPLRVPLIRTIC